MADDAIKAFFLARNEIANKKIFYILPENSFIVEKRANNITIEEILTVHEFKKGKLLRIGTCRKALDSERNSSPEYQKQKTNSKN